MQFDEYFPTFELLATQMKSDDFAQQAVRCPQYVRLIEFVLGYGLQSIDVSLARLPDGAATWDYDPTPTPGSSNDGS